MRKERGEELGPEWAMRVERAKELVEYGGYAPPRTQRKSQRGGKRRDTEAECMQERRESMRGEGQGEGHGEGLLPWALASSSR